ncbi:MAG: hypothetical protein JST85_03335 [Acidobacteria bacterium]|nr:hypothetical protein [Acidobacteriota bacterium]
MSKSKVFTKRVLLAVTLCLTMAVCFGVASIRSSVSGASIESSGQQGGLLDILQRQKMAIVGSWSTPDGDGLPGLITFNADGTLIESDVDHTFTSGHGTWAHLGGTQYAYTFKQYKKDDQDQVGFVVVYGTVNLDSTGTQFSGPLHFEFKDTTGKVDTDEGLDLKFEGERIQIRQ